MNKEDQLENPTFCTYVICTPTLMGHFNCFLPVGFRSLLLRMSKKTLVWFVTGISG